MEKRVKLYPRVSSKKQAEEGDSVDFQEQRLTSQAKLNNKKIVDIITDAGKSASISDDKIKIWHKDGYVYAKIDIKKRFGMNKILDSLSEDNWDELNVTKWDRFSRNDIFSQLMIIYFKDHNKEIVAIDDSNDNLIRGIMSVLGQEEIKKLKSRVRDVRLMRFEKGMFPARSPFGYNPIKKNKKVVGFKINEKEAKIIKECFNDCLNNIDYKVTCKRLGIYPQQYYNILKNRSYCGYVQFEGKEIKGTHKPIISEEIYNQAREKSNVKSNSFIYTQYQ